MNRETSKSDPYLQRLAKLLPAELVAAYIAITGVVTAADEPNLWLGISLVVIGLLVPLYLYFFGNVKGVWQLLISEVSFWIWAGNISPEFSWFQRVEPIGWSIMVILWCLIIPFAFGPPPPTSPLPANNS